MMPSQKMLSRQPSGSMQNGHDIVAPQTVTNRPDPAPQAPRHWVIVPCSGTGMHDPPWHQCSPLLPAQQAPSACPSHGLLGGGLPLRWPLPWLWPLPPSGPLPLGLSEPRPSLRAARTERLPIGGTSEPSAALSAPARTRRRDASVTSDRPSRSKATVSIRRLQRHTLQRL